MQIESLKVFCDVARFRSFSRGARENRITQSCASQTVQQLEHRLGTLLIDRGHRPWRLTAAGRIFYEGCRELVERFQQIEERIRGSRESSQALVRVAAIYSVGLGPMNQYVREFTQRHPGVRIQIEYLHPDRVYHRVLEGEADLGIVSYPRAGRRFAVIPWRYEPMTLVVPPAHPLAGVARLDLSRIQGEKFIALEQGLAIRREIDRFLRRHGVTVEVVQEFDNIEAVKRSVEVGSGISILPRVTLEREIHLGTLRAIPFTGDPPIRPLGLLLRRASPRGRNTDLFIRMLLQQKGSKDSRTRP